MAWQHFLRDRVVLKVHTISSSFVLLKISMLKVLFYQFGMALANAHFFNSFNLPNLRPNYVQSLIISKLCHKEVNSVSKSCWIFCLHHQPDLRVGDKDLEELS